MHIRWIPVKWLVHQLLPMLSHWQCSRISPFHHNCGDPFCCLVTPLLFLAPSRYIRDFSPRKKQLLKPVEPPNQVAEQLNSVELAFATPLPPAETGGAQQGPAKGRRVASDGWVGRGGGHFELQLWPEIPIVSTYNPIYGMYNPIYNQLFLINGHIVDLGVHVIEMQLSWFMTLIIMICGRYIYT